MAGDLSRQPIAGRYRLISQLAAGGMGITYRAWDLKNACPVVIKTPKIPKSPKTAADRSKAEMIAHRFVREIEAMRALAHEHIVPITDSGDDSGVPFVAMRFLPGGSLADHRRKDPSGPYQPVSPDKLHYWLRGIAEAIDFINSRGLVHRDVKPANIFFDGFRRGFLGDFGIAKVVDDSAGLEKGETLTGTQFAVGTPEYMAPELLTPRAKPDGRADQYALAVTVYELLAGKRPFTGKSAHIVVEHWRTPPPPLERKKLGLPASLVTAVERGLAKKPEERFENCVSFANAALSDIPHPASEKGVVRLLCPRCRRILKMPESAGGRAGACPRCKAPVQVATDLSALWEAREAGAFAMAPRDDENPSPDFQLPGDPPGAPLLQQDSSPLPIIVPSTIWRRRLRWPGFVMKASVATMIASLVTALVAGPAAPELRVAASAVSVVAMTASLVAAVIYWVMRSWVSQDE
ncbi:MAG: protein kinase [Pirellulales bacterium]|nr:protein kinase [Pirellulales bacterium]